MVQNIGTTDRVIRSLLALMLGVLMNLNVLSASWTVGLGCVIALLLWTSLCGSCPLYLVMRIRTVSPVRPV